MYVKSAATTIAGATQKVNGQGLVAGGTVLRSHEQPLSALAHPDTKQTAMAIGL